MAVHDNQDGREGGRGNQDGLGVDRVEVRLDPLDLVAAWMDFFSDHRAVGEVLRLRDLFVVVDRLLKPRPPASRQPLARRHRLYWMQCLGLFEVPSRNS